MQTKKDVADTRSDEQIQIDKKAEEKQAVQDWIDQINSEADLKAQKLSELFGCVVTPFVFIIEPLKDVAVGFLKTPDAKQSLKIFRAMIADEDSGCQLAIQSQLIRNSDLEAKNVEGESSDSRLMDVNGNYDLKYSALNFALLWKGQKCIIFYTDQFKKK